MPDLSDLPQNIKDTTICRTTVKPLDDQSVLYNVTYIHEFEGDYGSHIKEIKLEEFKFTDAARANWGSIWRMPTRKECQELIDNCKWQLTEVNDQRGYIIKSKINGKSIFLPLAGKINDTLLEKDGEYGVYWTSSIDNFDGISLVSYHIGGIKDLICVMNAWRFFGLPIRPVTK